MSDHHHSSHKEDINRLGRRAEKHGLHMVQLEVQDESDPNYGKYTLRNIQTGAGVHEPGSDGNRDWAMDERQVEEYLDSQSK